MAPSTSSSDNHTSTSLRLLQFIALAAVYRSSAFTTTAPSFATGRHSHVSGRGGVRPLFVIAEYPSKEDEKTNNNNRGNNNNNNDEDNNEDAWIETKGGFLPKIPGLIKDTFVTPTKRRTKNNNNKSAAVVPEQVVTIQEYKAVVADEKEQMVVVRFYAPWCKACKAVQQPYRKLCRDNPSVKFVECPVTQDNAYLHEGLGIPSLPYGHIYHPEAGLVEERKVNKHLFSEFDQVLQTYIEGECAVEYPEGDDDAVCVQAQATNNNNKAAEQ